MGGPQNMARLELDGGYLEFHEVTKVRYTLGVSLIHLDFRLTLYSCDVFSLSYDKYYSDLGRDSIFPTG